MAFNRLLAALTLPALLLAGCMGEPKVAVTKHGATIDVIITRSGAAEPPCIKSVTVTLDGADIAETRPIWALSTAQPNRCAATFVYGRVPAGYAQAAPATALAVGTRYLVEVSGPGLLGGATFTMRDGDGALTDAPSG